MARVLRRPLKSKPRVIFKRKKNAPVLTSKGARRRY